MHGNKLQWKQLKKTSTFIRLVNFSQNKQKIVTENKKK